MEYKNIEEYLATCPCRTVDVLIVGAGLSGLVFAQQAAACNKNILILEKRNHIAGNCYDFINEIGILESKYGAHIFHTNKQHVWDYVQQFSDWIPYEHRVLGFLDHYSFFPIPINRNTINQLCDQNCSNEDEARKYISSISTIDNIEIKNSEQSALSRVGSHLYDLIFYHYTKKQWDKYPSELDKSVLDRIPIRFNDDDRYFTDKYQAMPKHGYTQFCRNMIDSNNIMIVLNCDYMKLRHQINARCIIFTGPIDQYFCDSGLDKLEYRSIHFFRHHEYCDYFQPASVVNYPSPDYPFTRIVEYKHFPNQPNMIKDRTTIVCEKSTGNGEPYYPVPNDKNAALFNQYKKLAIQEEAKKNVHFVGRLANYKYYNMDETIDNALVYFQKLKNMF
jgi:UDP-galactopyranose mutase